MQKIKKTYRDTYTGEEVITKLTYSGSAWEKETDFIPNTVTNIYTTTQALVIGGGQSWLDPQFGFDVTHIKNHKGGEFGRNRLQTYGTNSVYKLLPTDFLVIDDDKALELSLSPYARTNIVYAHASAILEYPGKFYLIPQDPSWNAGTIATYMACFDGHKKIFLLGFDGEQGADAFYTKTMEHVFNTYYDVDFVRVTPTPGYYMPEEWKYCVNVRQITMQQFVIEADLG